MALNGLQYNVLMCR